MFWLFGGAIGLTVAALAAFVLEMLLAARGIRHLLDHSSRKRPWDPLVNSAHMSYIITQRSNLMANVEPLVMTGARATKRSVRAPTYIEIYRATPVERIDMIKHGVRAAFAKKLFADLTIGQGLGFEALKLSPATVNRKMLQDANLSIDESERVIGMAKLIGQLEAMIEESGTPDEFDAARWISRWLKEPLPAFGGARPVDFMDTMEGQAMVSKVLAQAQSGAYA